MLLVRGPVGKMNVDEREEGEITEYDDISSDEEITLRQRIAEIEATNLELEKLATLSNEVDEKENSSVGTKTKNGKRGTCPEIMAIQNAGGGGRKRPNQGGGVPGGKKKQQAVVTKAPIKPAATVKKRRRSKRTRKHSCQFIISDDEFDSYDALPLGTENLSPDPLPIEVEDDDDDLELKLRLEALQSKQEIKNDLQVILEQTRSSPPATAPSPPTYERPPIDEEQELRLIALKSAVVKKHLVRKKKREEARPYSPTDDALESFDVPSPPISLQNMDISPQGTPSPLSEIDHPVDMDIANEESRSPIFFSCTINTEPSDEVATQNGTALQKVEIQIDRATIVVDAGYDDEDPEKLRAFLLQKIGEAAKRKSMRLEGDVGIGVARAPIKEAAAVEQAAPQRVKVHRSSDSFKRTTGTRTEERSKDALDDDEQTLRATLLSKARQFKRAKSEENVSKAQPKKPLSEILAAQSKKVLELKSISRTVKNTTVEPMPLLSSPKPVTPVRNALISELRPVKVNPVIISLRNEDNTDSSSEFTEDEWNSTVDLKDNCNLSPMSIAMDSPQYSSSPLPKENFDEKLSLFLKKARQSVGGPESLAVPMKKVGTSRKIVKKVADIRKTVGLANAIQFGGTPAAVKHLPASTQLEYNRLIKRMHQLERQKKQVKANAPKKLPVEAANKNVAATASDSKVKPSPVKVPEAKKQQLLKETVTVIRKIDLDNKVAPLTVTIKNSVPGEEKQPHEEKNKSIPPTANKSPGRVSLKDRLKALTPEQTKMLLDVQQRKVVNKRKCLSQSLDVFLNFVGESMVANRQQIRMEMEVRRLRKLLELKEQALVAQRQLCSGKLHQKLQGQYKTVLVARQSLTTTSTQCLEIGRSVAVEGEANDFRLTDEGSEGLGAKYKKYRGEIEAYKELRNKIKKGVFTVSDHQQPELPVPASAPALIECNELKGAAEAETAAEPTNPAAVELKPEERTASLTEYKSPLEHMEYLDTANPNEIVCPFQLNGSCQDEECPYRHLVSS